MAVFTSAQDFFVSNSQSAKFELIQKPYVPRALRFSCQGPSQLREAKRAMETRMVITLWNMAKIRTEKRSDKMAEPNFNF